MKNFIKLLFFTALLSASTSNVASETEDIRIISTDGFVTELLFALDIDQNLVAVDVTSHLPEGYRQLANIGYHRTLSAEGILSLQPTQIIGSEFMGPEAVISVLKQANVDLIQLPNALTHEQLQANIKRLAIAFNRQEQGAHLSSLIDNKINQLQSSKLANKRIAFLLSMEPGKLRLAGASTSGDAFIHLLGANNVADFNNYRNISAESLLALNPDILLVAGRQPESAVSELLTANPVLEHTSAGKSQNILAINGSTLIAGLSIASLNEAIKLTNHIKPD